MAGWHKPLPLTSRRILRLAADVNGATYYREFQQPESAEEGINIAGLIYKELWHDPKTCEWTKQWSSDIGWLWVKLLSFVEDHDSKGIVTPLQAITVATLNHIPAGAINALVEAQGLDVIAGGYRIHNYLKRRKLSKTRAQAGKKGYSAMVKTLPGKTSETEPETFARQHLGVGVEVVKEIFELWKEVTGKTNAKLDSERSRLIREAVRRDGREDTEDAIRGSQNDPWADRPLYLELKYLIRSTILVEKFRDLQRTGKPAAPTQSQAVKNALTLMGRPA